MDATRMTAMIVGMIPDRQAGSAQGERKRRHVDQHANQDDHEEMISITT